MTDKIDISTMPGNTCSCPKCIGMCHKRPCWPLPDEAEAIMNAGFGNLLMEDYWVDSPRDVPIIAPAVSGSGGLTAPFWVEGECVFLDEHDRCILHNPGLKPIEGRLAHHDEEVQGISWYEIHESIAKTWDTDRGREVVNIWRRKYEKLQQEAV